MRRDFKGKTCVYCGIALADTEDHLFARSFLPVDLRSDLIKVPACQRCNNQKSKYENYLSVILPLFTINENLDNFAQDSVINKLEKNERLLRDLVEGADSCYLLNPNGVYEPSVSLQFDGKQFLELARMIIKGLVWHHFNNPLPVNYEVIVSTTAMSSLPANSEIIHSLNLEDVRCFTLANEVIKYEFIKKKEDTFNSMWYLDLYPPIKYRYKH